MSLYGELERRNVIRVGTAYVVAAWLIIQVVELLFDVFNLPERAVQVAVILLAIGFIPALVIAWIYEWTPEGVKRDAEAGEHYIPDRTSRWLDRMIIILLGIGLVYFAIDKFILAPEREATIEAEAVERGRVEATTGYYGDRSIAVMPFENLSADPEQAYFGDGIAEEILHVLARIRELRVISRSSSFAVRDRDEPLKVPEIAELLGVAHVLEGSIRRSGDQIRVTAQLIEANTDTHLWSHTYDRDYENVFEIQDEIAADVAKNLHLTLVEMPGNSPRTDPEAYALTLQAASIIQSQKPRASREIAELLDRALEIDPQYVPALEWTVMADYLLWVDEHISDEEQQRRWTEIRQRIRAIDPDNSYVLAGEGWDEAYRYNNLEVAADLFERAVNNGLNHSETIRQAASFARFLGRHELSIRLGRHAVAIDPLCFTCLYQLSRTYLYAGEFALAEEMRKRYLTLGDSSNYHYGVMVLLQGKHEEALELFTAPDRTDPQQSAAGRAMALHGLGRLDESAAALEELRQLPSHETNSLISEVCAYTGRIDDAFEALFDAVDDGDIISNAALNWSSTIYRPLRTDPRWSEFRELIGVSEERLSALEFNPSLPPVD